MKVSIIIAFYNSHGVVARQVKHFASMNLPDDIEFIFVDDGSNPPHNVEDYNLKNLRIHHTNDKRPWTQGIARNAGAKLAKGEYLFLTDIDQILSKEAIMDVYKFTGDKMVFPRHLGVLLEDGTLTQDTAVLEEYGMDMSRLGTKRGLYASVHGNTYAIKRSTFELIGGYDPRHCLYGHHAGERQGEDSIFNREWSRYAAKRGILQELGSKVYIFPIGRYNVKGDLNPKGLFHNLSYELVPQPLKP
ncbi:MAG: glycosyltransferase [Candidatus Paceibacterota bacterium]|jgi:glycosyltransferase involved in cell wall biosynthesis